MNLQHVMILQLLGLGGYIANSFKSCTGNCLEAAETWLVGNLMKKVNWPIIILALQMHSEEAW